MEIIKKLTMFQFYENVVNSHSCVIYIQTEKKTLTLTLAIGYVIFQLQIENHKCKIEDGKM